MDLAALVFVYDTDTISKSYLEEQVQEDIQGMASTWIG